ncbi:MAG: hypothetical protein ACFHX7_23780 [Pseudomonadota bacterium]
MNLSRRQVLRLALLGGAAGYVVKGVGQNGKDAMDGHQLYNSVVQYANFGFHQTATPADLATANWLATRLSAAGFDTRKVPFSLQQFFLEQHRLTVNGESMVAYPLWWPRTGECRGDLVRVQGTGSPRNLAGKVALVEVNTRGASVLRSGGQRGLITSLLEQGAVGVLALTPHPSGELVALNAMDGLEPRPAPVMLVGSRVADQLKDGDRVSMQIAGQLEPAARAYEVVGHYEGAPGKPEWVISTPASGWFQCAGERGPGIALWLAMAEWIGATRPPVNVTMVASSAHELNGVGIRHFVDHDAPAPERVGQWLHLGAGIATWHYETNPWKRTDKVSRLRAVMTNQAAMMPRLEAALAPLAIAPRLTSTPGGEMVLMAERGYPVWGFAGGSAHHHLMTDTPAQITGPEMLAEAGHAVLEIAAGGI